MRGAVWRRAYFASDLLKCRGLYLAGSGFIYTLIFFSSPNQVLASILTAKSNGTVVMIATQVG